MTQKDFQIFLKTYWQGEDALILDVNKKGWFAPTFYFIFSKIRFEQKIKKIIQTYCSL